MTNFRLLILNPDNLIEGDKVLTMGVASGQGIKYTSKPCKLQMEWVDQFKTKVWIDVPFEYDER